MNNIKYLIMLFVVFLIGCQKLNVEKENQAKQEIYKIVNKNGNLYSFGSCFFINYENKKYLVTAYHVVKDFKEIYLINKDEYIKDIKLDKMKSSENLDVAIFEILDYNNNYCFFDVRKKDEIKLMGYPYGKDLFISNGQINTNETNAMIVEGMSGGVVVDNEGYAIGVISARYVETVGGLFVELSSSLKKILNK